MYKRSMLVFSLLFSATIHAASFDCKKASTAHEKLICSNPELSAADAQMGQAYRSAVKAFPLKGFIQANQRGWLASYRLCGALDACLEQVKERTLELNDFSDASVYSDIDEPRFFADAAMLIFYERGTQSFVRLFGNWMPNAYMDPDKIKGYPHDGFVCDEQLALSQQGNKLVSNEDPTVSFVFGPNSVQMEGFVSCSARTGFADGTYIRM